MASFERSQTLTLIERLSERPRNIIVVSGPRQTGKTTLALQVIQQIQSDIPCSYQPADRPTTPTLSVDRLASIGLRSERTLTSAVEARDTSWLVRVWEQARSRAKQSHSGAVLVLDEIQKIPNWSETVKGLWDADRQVSLPLHVVLLGSAPLLMQHGLTESMAGRFETISMTHWSFSEMKRAFDFDVDQFVYFGGYPGAAEFVRDEERWRAYVSESLIEPNIERDILSMQRIDKPALLKRLFELTALYSGQILSYTKMLGQLHDAGNTTTLARYLDLLSRAGLMSGLPNYYMSSARQRASSPKLQVLNTALMTARSHYSFGEARADRSFWGRLVETTVGAHLLNTASRSQRVYYWRHGNSEVDFVLEERNRLLAIEVKSGMRSSNTQGLDAFVNQFKTARSIVVGETGEVSLTEFLSKPASNWF